ncbi:hypothetical protein, partial [Bacillus pseudomycoides]|uniref:hypothetical protein n=1 Tax=Bacillus pseudomycoides TaxID=64104 RepID=UPI001CD551F6
STLDIILHKNNKICSFLFQKYVFFLNRTFRPRHHFTKSAFILPCFSQKRKEIGKNKIGK